MYNALSQRLSPYVIKNILKGMYLAILSVFGIFVILPPYNNTVVKIFASLYVSNDFVGLFMVRLKLTTVMHHIASIIFLIYTWTTDFNNNRTAQMLLIYTWISSLNFGVNLYLGLR